MFYIVGKNETIGDIALKFHTNVNKIIEMNHLPDVNIKENDILQIEENKYFRKDIK